MFIILIDHVLLMTKKKLMNIRSSQLKDQTKPITIGLVWFGFDSLNVWFDLQFT